MAVMMKDVPCFCIIPVNKTVTVRQFLKELEKLHITTSLCLIYCLIYPLFYVSGDLKQCHVKIYMYSVTYAIFNQQKYFSNLHVSLKNVTHDILHNKFVKITGYLTASPYCFISTHLCNLDGSSKRN